MLVIGISAQFGAGCRTVFKGGVGGALWRQNKRTFTGTLSASWSWDVLYFKGWRLAVGNWWQLAVGCWRLVAAGGGWWLAVGGW